MSKVREWINKHPEASVVLAQIGVVTTVVVLGVGLSKTFRDDAHKQALAAKAKLKALEEENLRLYRIIDNAVEATWSDEAI